MLWIFPRPIGDLDSFLMIHQYYEFEMLGLLIYSAMQYQVDIQILDTPPLGKL